MDCIKYYSEYEALFDLDLVVIVRDVLLKIEDNNGYDIANSKEHQCLVSYFNKYGLHKKLSESEFKNVYNGISGYDGIDPGLGNVIKFFIKAARYARNFPDAGISVDHLRSQATFAEINAEQILGKELYESLCEQAFKE